MRRRSGGVKEENMERKRKREKEVEEKRWGKISGLTREIHIPEIVDKLGSNCFKTKSQSMTKPADEFPQPFPHVLSRHV